MANFGPKPWSNPFGQLSIFAFYELLVFIAQKGVFSFQNIIKHIFVANIAYNNEVKKWPILDQNHELNPLENSHFFDFLNFLLLQPRQVFFVLEYYETQFPGSYCLKKLGEKMANFGPKPLTNPFGKLSIFGLFDLLVFIAQKGVFSFQNIIKDIFLAYIE